MVGSRIIWGGAIVFSLLAHAGAAAVMMMAPEPAPEEALIAGGTVAEVAMLGSGAFEAIESGNPEEVVVPEEIQPEEIEPVQPEIAAITPQEIEPVPVDPVETPDVQPVAPEAVETLEVEGAEVEIAAIPVPEVKPEIVPEERAEAIEPEPEEKKEEPVKKIEPKKKKVVKKAGEKGNNKITASKGQIDGALDAKTASLGGKKQGRSSEAGNAAVSNYPGKVRREINRAKRRVRSGASGDVVISFVVTSSGAASSIRVARSSGNAELDKAALDTVRRASPFARIPEGAGRSSWLFNIPIGFN